MPTGFLAPDARLRVFSDLNVVLPGAKLHTYVSGTPATPLPTYSDAGLTVPNANPIEASAGGLFGPIYLTPGVAYKFVLTASDGTPVWEQDPVGLQADGAINVRDYGAIGDGVHDDTAAIVAAYAAAKVLSWPMQLPAGIYKFTSTLVWDGYVSVQGAGRGNATKGTILKKSGNIVGIQINAGGENVDYRDFVLDSFGGLDASTGIEINDGGASGLALRNITVRNQGSHGIDLLSAALDRFDNISCISNAGVGFRCSPNGALFVIANTFSAIDVRSNGSHGMQFADGGAGGYANVVQGLIAQNNVGYGLQIDTSRNVIVVYVETNTAGDVGIATTAQWNFVTLTNSSVANPAVIDAGVDNLIYDLSTGRIGLPSTIGRPIPSTNIAGRSLTVAGGNAGPGGAGHSGGSVSLSGGSAVGTAGAAAGGAVNLTGGTGVNGGAVGPVNVQTVAAGLLGFYGVTAIARAVLATGAGHTVDDVITALQNLGLVKQV